MAASNQDAVKNKDFWDELCGSNLFSHLGLKEINEESLKVFDDFYFGLYPYLKRYISPEKIRGKAVMEIGLGFGTLSQYLMSCADSYLGVDYSDNPVKIVNDRAEMNGYSGKARAINCDARNLKDVTDANYDVVVSIGCLHHTGDTQKALDEIYRVLKPKGYAIIMLYNKNSFRRRFTNPYRYFILRKKNNFSTYKEYTRGSYDANSKGEAAPIVDLYSKAELKLMFRRFSSVKIKTENFDNYCIRFAGKMLYCPREKFLNNIAKRMGLDNYITAQK